MKILKIFIGSSIFEFEKERLDIYNFLCSLANVLNLSIEPFICELHDTNVNGRKQNEYNESIKDSSLSFFIFGKKAGMYTLEELKFAQKSFEDNGNPEVTVFLENFDGYEPIDSSITNLNDFLKEQKISTVNFENINTVKYHILNRILRQTNFKAEIIDNKIIVNNSIIRRIKVSEIENI